MSDGRTSSPRRLRSPRLRFATVSSFAARAPFADARDAPEPHASADGDELDSEEVVGKVELLSVPE